eukprot:CCRYP_019417-RA/>CCRYP_019417-RA protein AED:0.98 eAED:1.00 QI:0/0/0/0.5/1/1/2/0/243
MLAFGYINRHFKYGKHHFDKHIFPRYKELFEELHIVSPRDAKKMFDAFAKMDVDGSGSISCVEFHRYFGWKRGVFTERIFDSYLVPQDAPQNHLKDTKSGLSFEQFLVCVWNYCSYDEQMMAQYVFNIFDIDKRRLISMDECYALLRMVYDNKKEESCCAAMSMIRHHVKGEESITLDSFRMIVVANNAILRPAFDYQSHIIEKITGKRSSWDEYREKRRRKFGSEELIDVKCKGKIIAHCMK